MPSGNRVERLEEQVQELEATVEGLTEELVEANERIRQLEGALSGGSDTGSGDEVADTAGTEDVLVAGDDGQTPDESEDDLEKQFEVDAGADPEEVEQAASSIVSPDDAADTTKADEDETGDEGDTDDIIVA